MKACVAQTIPIKGDIDKNIDRHKKLIDVAASHGTDIVVFPELSLTGYEPELAKELAITQEDKRLDVFQEMSNDKSITIGVGIPIRSDSGIYISMLIFQPNAPRQTYSKQYLHKDEEPYFISGQQQVLLPVNNTKIAPAICYESLLPQHAENANRMEANIYIASVAKSANGIVKANMHYPKIAKQYSMPVLMANCVGPCDNFVSEGKSSVWNKEGLLKGQLNNSHEGILIFDTETEEVIEDYCF